jgi:L-amino acid N-acyltransferase YncA
MRIKPEQLQIRLATIADLPMITVIYNEAVRNGVATFDTEA